MSSKKKRKLGSYPSTSVVGSMLLALVVLGIFGLILIVSDNLSQLIRENMQVQVYLDKDLSESQRMQVEKTIVSMDFVLKKDQEAVITFVSKDEAAKTFIEETGEDFYEFLGENPLRDSYKVNIDLESANISDASIVKQRLEEVSGVYEVDYVESMVNEINENITRIGLILMGFAIILILVVIILIHSTIKLALFSQRFLIRSMQLVGAKKSFIQAPFLNRSLLQGFVSGIFASVFIYILLQYGQKNYPEIEGLYTIETIIVLFCGLAVMGALVAFTGTWLAMRRFMRMSLDELY